MRISYDPTVDAFALTIGEATEVDTIDQGDGVHVDVAPDGAVLGIEILGASRYFDRESLAKLGIPSHELSLREAATQSGLDPGTLRVLLNNGRLRGAKRGRDWVVQLADLMTYLESRAPTGRPPKKAKARRRPAKRTRV